MFGSTAIRCVGVELCFLLSVHCSFFSLVTQMTCVALHVCIQRRRTSVISYFVVSVVDLAPLLFLHWVNSLTCFWSLCGSTHRQLRLFRYWNQIESDQRQWCSCFIVISCFRPEIEWEPLFQDHPQQSKEDCARRNLLRGIYFSTWKNAERARFSTVVSESV